MEKVGSCVHSEHNALSWLCHQPPHPHSRLARLGFHLYPSIHPSSFRHAPSGGLFPSSQFCLLAWPASLSPLQADPNTYVISPPLTLC